MSNKEIRQVPVKDIRREEGSEELAGSADMRPYIELAMAGMQGRDITAEVERIAQLPLHKRYIWRVASALKWGFADFDTSSVVADRETLSRDDFAKVMELLTLRPMQFCLLLKALVGAEEMERVMTECVLIAKQGV